ncbi:MAG: TetR family transcriptional regulator [Paraglaciecola sp.]|nr:TetR family transcriptional regulator [Paraglaciecola sp.]NCT49137.1 TetR family transcriptional regulator [Paraglaciecola sp.]
MKQSEYQKDDSIGSMNRHKIMAAAEYEFALHGYAGTRVQHIADRAQLPKTNVLYYFKCKEGLYLALLEEILSLWNGQFDEATAEDDPAVILAAYIRDKMTKARQRSAASKVFALEIINGAPNLNTFFREQHCQWMAGRVQVLYSWMAQGKMKALNPEYLLFHIWATCQHYADFAAQITQLKGKPMGEPEFAEATDNLIELILTGCGLTVPERF